MSDFKALENVSDRIQGIISGAYTRCKNVIKSNVKITGGMGKDGNPKDIIGFMEAHGTGSKNRPGSARTFEGMGLALEMLEMLSQKDNITNADLEDLDKINEILLAMLRDTTVGKNATNPQNIRFKVVVGFKIDKKTGKPIKIERDFVFGHFKTPTVLRYLEVKKKYLGSEYDGPEYTETAEQVKYWSSPKENTSRPPLFIALQKFQAEITKIKDDLEEEPSPDDPIVINIDKGVQLAPFAKLASIREGFIAILSNDSIYPKKPKTRKGSNRPVWTSDTRPNFRDSVNEYVFSITGDNDRRLLDEAVPAWGDDPDDLAVTQIYDSFKIRVNSTRRMKTLARLCLGSDAKSIELPGRTSGVVLKGTSPRKDTELQKGKRRMNKIYAMLIDRVLDKATEPLSTRQILDLLYDEVDLYDRERQKKVGQRAKLTRRAFPTYKALSQYLRDVANKTGTVRGSNAALWVKKKNKDDEVQKAKMPLKFYTDLIDEIMGEPLQKPLTTRQVSDIMHYKFQKVRHDRRYADGSRAKFMSGRYFPDLNQIRRYLMKNYVPIRTGKYILWGGTRR